VTVLRPLAFMAARQFGFETLLLVSARFAARDATGIWRNELSQISAESGARIEVFSDDWDARRHFSGQGLLFSASESHLPQHATTHNIFRHAPAGFLKVTVQHGFECVGFRHSADHVRAHGPTASFGADIICSWSGADHLPSLAPSQRAKLLVTGPTSVLQTHAGSFERARGTPGLVCENLHSVRFKGAGDIKREFVDTFAKFARATALRNRRITLRAHPGGQYALRNKLALQRNVTIENAPIYRLDLRRFAYGISAPSSVLIDMLLADIPTAVWRDRQGQMDTSSYDGLPTVSSAREWLQFVRMANENRESLVARQQEFLRDTGMPLEPREVFCRFAELFRAAERMEIRPAGSIAERERVLFLSDADDPKLHTVFERPLDPLVAKGELAIRRLTEQQLRDKQSLLGDDQRLGDWVEQYLNGYNPSAIVLCRYSGPACRSVFDWARRERVPAIYYVDEDLLDLLRRKEQADRLATVSEMLNSADLVYASTKKLRAELLSDFPNLRLGTGRIALDVQADNMDERVATAELALAGSGQESSAAYLRKQVLAVIAEGHAAVAALSAHRTEEEASICQGP
jgi:hypothetical protein